MKRINKNSGIPSPELFVAHHASYIVQGFIIFVQCFGLFA